MKLRMHENSLFAILLRSQWWISVAIGIALTAIGTFIVPKGYAAFVGLPFLVIGAVAAWRQLRVPGAARVERTVAAVRAMSWDDFARALEEGFQRDGYRVSKLDGADVDFELVKAGRTSVVGCKRWKAARLGVETLRGLYAAKREQDAHECICVTTGELSDPARAFASEKNIRVMHGVELARLLPHVGRA